MFSGGMFKCDDASFAKKILSNTAAGVCAWDYNITKQLKQTTNIKQHYYHHHSAHLTFVIQMSKINGTSGI